MKHFKGFKRHYPESGDTVHGMPVQYTRNHEGKCWYDLRNHFSPNTVKVVYNDKTGKVISFSKDATALFPHEGNVIEFETVPADLDFFHWKVNLNTLQLEHCPDEIYKVNKIKSHSLLQAVMTHVASLQLIGDLNEEEQKQLNDYREYVIALRAVDLTQRFPQWPESPL